MMVSDWPSAANDSDPSEEEPYSPEVAYSVTPFTTSVSCGSTICPTTVPVVVSSSSAIGAAWLSP